MQQPHLKPLRRRRAWGDAPAGRHLALTLIVCLTLLTACSASSAPVVKIGLVAPFEGRYRVIGYEALYAARLAIREINRAGGVEGYRVELFALDDGGDPAMAVEQARKLALDPQVVAVIGHFHAEATGAAIDAYCDQRLALLAVEATRSGVCSDLFVLAPAPGSDRRETDPASFLFYATVPPLSEVPDAKAFVEAYNAIPIDGTRAGPIALQAYDAMYVLFDALGRAIRADSEPTRASVSAALMGTEYVALGGVYRFGAEGRRLGALLRVYRYGPDREPELVTPDAPSPR